MELSFGCYHGKNSIYVLEFLRVDGLGWEAPSCLSYNLHKGIITLITVRHVGSLVTTGSLFDFVEIV
jgi:hypothetical protein